MLEKNQTASSQEDDLAAFRNALPVPRQMTDEEYHDINAKIKSGEICMPDKAKVEEAKEQAKADEDAFMKQDKAPNEDSIHKALGKQELK